MIRSFMSVVLTFILTGCTAAVSSTPTITATSTQTPQPTPTFTPAFTATPTFLETSTLEVPSATPTSEGTSTAGLSCSVVSQSIRNNHHFDPKERFSIGWSVRNNGTATWDPANIDFAYFSGIKMYQYSPTPLPTTVAPHDAPVALGADMVAPKNPGRYTTVWTLRQGDYDFCHVSLTIKVP